MKYQAFFALVLLVGCGPAFAQEDPGARAGTSYVPSTHTKGCAGLMCDGNDPQRQAGPPPPCQGLICGIAPYGMQPPITASEAARIQEERARAAAAAPQAEPDVKDTKKRRKPKIAKVKKTKAAPKAVAARTPDPAAAPPPAPEPPK